MDSLIKANENAPRRIMVTINIESFELDNHDVMNPNNSQKKTMTFSMLASNLLDSHTKTDIFIEGVKKCLK